MKDPVRGLWALADMNGGLSKWEDRTVRITSIERDCRIDEAAAAERQIYFEADSCDSSANLHTALISKIREQVIKQPCFDDGSFSKHCPGIHPSPYHGTASITVTGVNKSDGDFTSKVRLTADECAAQIRASLG